MDKEKIYNKKIKKDFQSAHKNYFDKISNFIKYRVNDQETAMEISQEVFLSMWQYISNGGKIRDKRKFLYTIAKNKIIDHYRNRKYETSIDDVGENYLMLEAMQEKEIDNNIDIKIIGRLMSELDDKYKKIITYRYIRQMSIDEICQTTGKSPNYVSVLIHKGIKILENKIKQMGNA